MGTSQPFGLMRMSDCSRNVCRPSTGDLQSRASPRLGSHTWDHANSVSSGPERRHHKSKMWRPLLASVGCFSLGHLKRCPSHQQGWRVTLWSYSTQPKSAVIERCEGCSMDGDGLGSVSSGPMPKPVTSLKVSRWFGEGLRQWRRPSRASSATPRTQITSGTTYGRGAPPLPSTAPPTSPTSYGGGGGAGWPRLWSRLWGTLTLQWLGYWSCRGLRASKLLMVGWLCSWRTCGAMPCMPSLRGPPPVRRRRYLYLSVRGLLYLLLIWMWRRFKRRWTALGVILTLRPFRPHCQDLGSPRRRPGVHRLPQPQPPHQSPAPQSSHQDPNLRPGSEENGRGVPGQLSRPRGSVPRPELTPTRRGSRGRSLVWAVCYLSDGIMRRARRWAWVLRGPADLPSRDGILMGF